MPSLDEIPFQKMDGSTGSLAEHAGDVVLVVNEKFLVGRDATVVARFAPSTKPDDPAVVAAIESALG